jgi:membrane protease subunit HflK
MSWNEPGSGDKGPWGNGSGGKRPDSPDLEDVIRNVRKKFGGGFGGSGGKGGEGLFASWPLLLIVAAGWWLYQSVYIVDEGFESVELRFGKHTGTQGAGLNMVLWPIEQKRLVNTQQINTIEVGYRDATGTRKGSVPTEALMLTNDENIVDVNLTVQYNIKSAEDLLFNIGHVDGPLVIDAVVRGATESALREIVGNTKMDGVLTEERGLVTDQTMVLLQSILDRYNTGINVLAVEMQQAQAPEEVRDAFDDVVKADQDRERFVNEAEAYANDIIPRARGQAARILQEADAYKETVIAKASGEASRFDQILTEYTVAPDITRKRLYLETMETVFSNTNKVMLDQQGGGNSLMYLPIDKLVGERREPAGSSVTVQSMPSTSNMPVTNERAGADRGREIRQ